MKSDDPKRGGEPERRRGEQALNASDLRRIGEQIAREFPLTAGHPGVVLMDVDPLHLHAYWDQDPASVEDALQEMARHGGSSHLVLRFRDIPDTQAGAGVAKAVHAFDLEIQAPSGHERVRVPSPGHCYEAELGVTAEDGGWRMLTRSNRVCMPSGTITMEPADLSLNLESTEQPPADESSPSAEDPGAKPLADTRESDGSPADPSLAPGGPKALEPSFPNVAPQPQPQSPSAADAQSDEAMSVLPDVPVQVASAETTTWADEALAYPEELPVLSSSALAALELRAELHLYGKGAQGRTLELFGRRVKVKEDGSFELVAEVDPRSPAVLTLLEDQKKSSGHGT